MLSKKDVVEINKGFSTGKLMNESSLDYAVKTTARSRNWLRSAALLARSILIDHAFEDGNKRTAAAAIMLLMDLNDIQFNPEEIPKVVVKILKKNITSLTEIERCIKDAIK
ncbi:MAG: Fic family protein [Candidatus Woesearchaeota archaeon]|nr:Fic family protein [Candidatus Woesearchaeota archaeon]